jgi:hypothetical protein
MINFTTAERNKQFEIRVAFQMDKAPLEYRKRGTTEWNRAYWSDWDWETYEYRIKPNDPKASDPIPLVPVLYEGIVYWMSVDKFNEFKTKWPKLTSKIDKFRTIGGVRNAILAKEE